MFSNLKREFCSRLLLFISASFAPALFVLLLIRYPNANIFDPIFNLSCLTIIIFGSLLRLGGLYYQDKLRDRKEILRASLFETAGYALASITVAIAVLPTKYPKFLEVIFSEKLWTQKIYLFYILCLFGVGLGVLATLISYRNTNVPSSTRRRMR
jgi:amino acid permease